MLRVAEHAERTDTGRQRKGNEDAYFARSPLFAVADGMGGAQAGEVASRAAIEAIEHGLPDGPGSAEERLAGLVLDANERIIEMARADRERAGMGTTMTAAYVTEGDVAVAHVGDSRMYRLRGGELQRLTEDHTLVAELERQALPPSAWFSIARLLRQGGQLPAVTSGVQRRMATGGRSGRPCRSGPTGDSLS